MRLSHDERQVAGVLEALARRVPLGGRHYADAGACPFGVASRGWFRLPSKVQGKLLHFVFCSPKKEASHLVSVFWLWR